MVGWILLFLFWLWIISNTIKTPAFSDLPDLWRIDAPSLTEFQYWQIKPRETSYTYK